MTFTSVRGIENKWDNSLNIERRNKEPSRQADDELFMSRLKARLVASGAGRLSKQQDSGSNHNDTTQAVTDQNFQAQVVFTVGCQTTIETFVFDYQLR